MAFNAIMFRIEKDKYDKDNQQFPLLAYVSKTWDNWLASLLMIPVILYAGYKGLGLDAFGVVDVNHIGWSDAYYLGAGFFTELIIVIYEKWKAK